MSPSALHNVSEVPPPSRVERVLALIDPLLGKGLEIGPCCSPLLRKDQADLQYVDYLPTDKLREKYAGDQFLGEVPVDLIVDVDVVWETGRLLKDCLPPPGVVDWVVASHVVEHAPDLVGWLAEIESVLVPGGVLSLIVPDKRFTFDAPRAESTFGDVLEAYLLGARLPRLKSVYDYFSTAVRVTPEDLMKPSLDVGSMPLYYSKEIAMAQVRACVANRQYVDVHNLVVTPWSFVEILASVMHFDMTGFEVGSFFPTAQGDFEFFVSLVKLPEHLSSNEKRARQLSSLPVLPPASEMSG